MNIQSSVITVTCLLAATSLSLLAKGRENVHRDRVSDGTSMAAIGGDDTEEDAGQITVRFTMHATNVLSHGAYMEIPEDLNRTERRSIFLNLDALRYLDTRFDPQDPDYVFETKFNAICAYDSLIHDDSAYDNWTCSPMFRDSLSLGIDAGIPVGGQAKLGVSAFASARVAFHGELEAGVGLEFPVQRRFKHPLSGRQAQRAPGQGGNILAESGIGSLLAGQAIIVRHECPSAFGGNITYVLTHPANVNVVVGYYAPTIDEERFECFVVADGSSVECSEAFKTKLTEDYTHGCHLGTISAEENGEVDFEIQELVDALDDAHDTITMIKDDVQQRALQRTAEIAQTFGEKQSQFFDQLKERAEDAAGTQLENVRQLAREFICPND